jgi:Protein of unknown function (DUF2723)
MVKSPLEGRLGRAVVALGAPLAVAVLVIVNAAPGVMPGVGFWDTGEFQTVLPILGTAHPTGYPTYVLIGFMANLLLTPFGEPAFRINLLSLLAVASAAAATVALMKRLTDSTAIAIATGVGLALTPIVWANATRADPHPLHLAFVALLLLVLVIWEQKRRLDKPHADRWLVGAAVVFGLAAGNHSLTLLLAPPIGLFVLASDPRIIFRPRLLAICAVALVGTVVLVYLELPLRAGPFRAPLVYADPQTWDGFWYIALAEQFRGSLSDPLGDLPTKIGGIWQLASGQFGVLAYLLLPAFLVTARKVPGYALLTGSAMVITLLFDASYLNADINRYYLGPLLWAWTWLGILAAWFVRLIVDAIPGSEARFGSRAVGSLANALAVGAAIALLLPAIDASGTSRQLANRSYDTLAAEWLGQAMPALATNAVVVSWWSTSTPLWYGQKVEGLRPDVLILDDRTLLDDGFGDANTAIARYLGQRPVYVIRASQADLAVVQAQYNLRPIIGAGNVAIYLVVGRQGGSG